MVTARIYVEGGGDHRELKTKCRKAFKAFFERYLAGRMPRVVACGGRQTAYDDFCTALTHAKDGDFIVLLVDSEGPVAETSGPWLHLKNRDNWDKPDGATDDHAHLMVQCMEAWFLADKDCPVTFFGHGFNERALPGRSSIEEIPKRDIEEGLKRATRQCDRRGAYHKGHHSFEILAELNSEKVFAASPHAKRLIDALRDRTEQS